MISNLWEVPAAILYDLFSFSATVKLLDIAKSTSPKSRDELFILSSIPVPSRGPLESQTT